jgi:hypothetical protein
VDGVRETVHGVAAAHIVITIDSKWQTCFVRNRDSSQIYKDRVRRKKSLIFYKYQVRSLKDRRYR